MAITYRINSYEEHIKHDLELNVTNILTGMTGILRLTRDKGYKLIFHGIRCDVRQIKEKLDIFGVESLKVLAYDEFNSFGERTLVFDFNVDTSIKHEIDYSAGGASKLPKTDVVYNKYVDREFTVSITKPTGESYTFYGNEDTAVYVNAREVSDFYDKELAGSGVRKVIWHWFHSPQIDRWIKVLDEIRFIKYNDTEAEKEKAWVLKNLMKYDIHVLKTRLDIKKAMGLNSTGLMPYFEFIPHDPSEFELNDNKEEKEMKKEINAQAVWNSMSKAQQELCCDLIGNAAKGRISKEIKMAIIKTKISRYSGKVRGEDIRDIIFNGPATIILWRDGTKTVVKQQKGDKWDPEKAVALAVMKKTFGTNTTGSDYLDYVKPYIQKAYEDEKKRKAAARRKKTELKPGKNE